MTETEAEATPVTKVARDLTEILKLHDALLTQAVHHANAQVDNHSLPGGHAMIELGSIANIEAWTNQQDTTERLGRAYTSAEDEDPDDAWPAFQLIEFWSEQWRVEHGAEYGQRPTIASEANFLRYSLNWAWDHEPHFDEFAADIRRARLRLEDIVYAGKRVERTRVLCDRCDTPRRLIKLYAIYDPSGVLDSFKCPACKAKFTPDEFKVAYRRMLASEGAERYVTKVEALAVLATQGTRPRAIHKWLAPHLEEVDRCTVCSRRYDPDEWNVCPRKLKKHGEETGEVCGGQLERGWHGDQEDVVLGYCDTATHQTFLWWPDLWTKHLTQRGAPSNAA